MTAALALFAVPVLAADSSAIAFVTRIYDTYRGSGAQGLQLDSERAVRSYFERSLATLIIKDRKKAARHGEVGQLDGDPFIDRKTGISTSLTSMSPTPDPVRQRRRSSSSISISRPLSFSTSSDRKRLAHQRHHPAARRQTAIATRALHPLSENARARKLVLPV